MKIALHGHGKMGKTVERVAQDDGHQIVAIYDVGLTSPFHDAEVVIDFSHASAVEEAVALACERRVPIVIGTTGWSDRMKDVQSLVEKAGIGCVYASNFSPGANAVFALARRSAELFARFPQYAAGIEERHHSAKKDVPSGTALRIAEEVRQGSVARIDPPVAASRVGSEFGLHTLFFDSPDDLVEISHRARGRDGFARGAVFAAQLIRGRSGVIRFDELLESAL